MGSLLDTTNVYEIRVRHVNSLYNQEFDLVRHYKVEGPVATAGKNTEDLLDKFRAAYRTAVLPRHCNTTDVGFYECRSIIDRQPSPRRPGKNKLLFQDLIVFAGTGADEGGEVATPMPPTDSLSIECRASMVGRRFFGCIRWGPIPKDKVEAGRLLAAALADYTTMAAFFKADIDVGNDVTGKPVIFNKTRFLTATAPVLPPASWTVNITNTVLSVITGTELHRKRPIRRLGF